MNDYSQLGEDMKTWKFDLDHDQMIALARAMHLMMEHCQLGLVEDAPTTLANLLNIIKKFPSDDEFVRLKPEIVEAPEVAQ